VTKDPSCRTRPLVATSHPSGSSGAVSDEKRSSHGKVRSEDVAVQFGRSLLRFRRKAGMSQEELAAKAGLHRTEIGKVEQGTRTARVDTLVRLAGALSVSPSALLEGVQWSPSDDGDEGRFIVGQRETER
jgi:ribosome-binding protein aMBF1 (putative translation factor)